MSSEIGIEQARAAFGDIVNDAKHGGKTTYITRRGDRAAAVVPVRVAEREEEFIHFTRPTIEGATHTSVPVVRAAAEEQTDVIMARLWPLLAEADRIEDERAENSGLTSGHPDHRGITMRTPLKDAIRVVVREWLAMRSIGETDPRLGLEIVARIVASAPRTHTEA